MASRKCAVCVWEEWHYHCWAMAKVTAKSAIAKTLKEPNPSKVLLHLFRLKYVVTKLLNSWTYGPVSKLNSTVYCYISKVKKHNTAKKYSKLVLGMTSAHMCVSVGSWLGYWANFHSSVSVGLHAEHNSNTQYYIDTNLSNNN